VLRDGAVTAEFAGSAASEEGVGRAALSLEAWAGRDVRRHRGAPGGRGATALICRVLLEREAALVLALLAIISLTARRSPDFLSFESLRDVATNTAPLAVATLGQTLMIASGGIDISVGSMLALCAASAATFAGGGGSALASCLVALLLGAALGSVNALLSAAGRIHPVVATLGTMGIYRGILLLWTEGNWITLPPHLLAVAEGGPLGVPGSVWGTAGVAILVFGFLRSTRSGRACLEIGDNEAAARAHGLPVARVRWCAFTILGAAVGLAGVFYTARYGKVQSNTGVGFELQTLAAAVLGGAHVAGGRGTVSGALLGSALLGLLAAARASWGIQERWQLVMVGGVMLAALALETVVAHRFRRGKP
jgi:rhamnose transport system permease protein